MNGGAVFVYDCVGDAVSLSPAVSATQLIHISPVQRTASIVAHSDDTNAVTFLDNDSTNILISGSDDMLCKVRKWQKVLLPLNPPSARSGTDDYCRKTRGPLACCGATLTASPSSTAG